MSFYNLASINSPTVPLPVTAVSAAVALPQQGRFIQISNLGANPAWVCTGAAAVTAVASTGNNVCVPAGSIMSFSVGNYADTTLAAICASGQTTTLSISVTNGQ